MEEELEVAKVEVNDGWLRRWRCRSWMLKGKEVDDGSGGRED